MLTLTLLPALVSAQSKPPRFVILDDYIREQLRQDWDAHANDSTILERGYCLRWQYDFWAQEKAYRVTQITPAVPVTADEGSIEFHCTGAQTAELHVHPPSTCFENKQGDTECWKGGPYAWQCLPSDNDRAYVILEAQPFGMVQCSRDATVFYFGTGDNR